MLIDLSWLNRNTKYNHGNNILPSAKPIKSVDLDRNLYHTTDGITLVVLKGNTLSATCGAYPKV
jgi:hypothetical protein